jgi:hypothetical protein
LLLLLSRNDRLAERVADFFNGRNVADTVLEM